MLLKKTTSKQQAQMEQIKGIYVPKEKRQEARQEVVKAHFQIGSNDQKFPAKSFSHDHFASVEVQAHKGDENKKIAQQIKKTHFTIGESRQFYQQTQHSSTYNKDQHENFQSSQLNQNVKNDLRKAHFNFGNDQVSYQTTNKQSFISQEAKAIDKKQQEGRKQKQRQQNFTYGQDVPQYQSMAKKDFQSHNTDEAVKNLQLSKQNGRELRKSHFMFGSDSTPFEDMPGKQVAQSEIKQNAQGSSIALRKSNFQINQAQSNGDFFTYETVNGTQMNQVMTGGNDPHAKKNLDVQMQALKQDLRQAHFHLGNHQPQYESSSKSALITHEVGNSIQKEAQEVGSKMQKVSFTIGDDKKRELRNAQTTYSQTISSVATLHNQQRQASNMGLRNSHFNFGSERQVSYVSEAKEKFQPQVSNQSDNKDLSKALKAHHFTIAETNTKGSNNYYESVAKQEYNYKGDASKIRGTMANEVKADLRASHFKVGFEQTSPFGNSLTNTRPTSAFNNRPFSQVQSRGNLLQQQQQQAALTQRPTTTNAAAEVNKASHVFSQQQKTLSTQYKTSNQTFFKWIQPAII